MRVKKLDIFGFKSFASRQHIDFGDGVTCVVGPNGCGKSNVVDALRWVMGEQNARHLRGGNMQDIIFCGSEKKAALGFAEVTLTLENNDQSAPLEYSHFNEIAITRRLYKTGDSEYEINKQKVRLKDISDFFLGTGIGAKAYSIIEQGRVNEVVSAKAGDRRAIIEEAAGISKYKSKKVAAEKRIENTRINLDRIIDIKNEIENRVKMLAREKEKLDKVISLKEKIRDLDLHIASHKYLECYSRRQYLSNLNTALLEDSRKIQSEAGNIEHIFTNLLDEYRRKTDQAKILNDLAIQHKNTLELIKKDLEHIKSTFSDNQNLISQIENQLAEINLRKKEIETDIANFEADFKESALLQEKILASLAGKNESGKFVINKRLENLNHEKNLRTKMLESATSAARLQAQISSLQEQDVQKKQEIKNLQTEITSKTQETSEINSRLSGFTAEYEHGKIRRQELNSQIEIKNSELQDEQQKALIHRANLRKEEAEELSLASRLKSLEEIDSHREWSESGIHILQSLEAKTLVKGIVADAISVSSGQEELVEKCLSHILDAGIIDSSLELKNIANILKQKKLSSTSFYLLSDDDNSRNSARPLGLVCLSNFVTIKDKSLAGFAAKIARYFVADTLENALEHWPAAKLCNAFIISRTEELLMPDGRAILLGANNNKGILKRKNNILDIRNQIEQKLINLTKLKAEASQFEINIKNLEEIKTALITEVRPLNSGLIRLEEYIKQKENELRRNTLDLQTLNTKLNNLSATSINCDEKLALLKKEWSEALLNHRLFEEKLEEANILRGNVELEYETFQQELKTIEISKAAILEKTSSLKISLDQAHKNLAHLYSQEKAFAEQTQNKTKETLILSEKERQANKRCAELEIEISKTVKLYETTAKESLELNDKKITQEKSLQELNSILQDKTNKINEAKLLINNANNDIDNICERIKEKHNLNLALEITRYHHIAIKTHDAQKEMEELRRSLERLGGVNENAGIEYDEFHQRKVFLETQVEDLQDALTQLESAIKKINKTTKLRFIESFNNINTQFTRVFPRLFNGGRAELRLTDDEDLLNCGVEIFAQPPGKNIGSIDLMSGGEKALTAISLIMAIFLIKPSPFCLLDEVDAPLDEANVSRFSQLIKEMSERSQFIVITHNRKTMESADKLYGVTMEDAGSSKIVSVHVREAFETLGKTLPPKAKSGPKPTQLFLDEIID